MQMSDGANSAATNGKATELRPLQGLGVDNAPAAAAMSADCSTPAAASPQIHTIPGTVTIELAVADQLQGIDTRTLKAMLKILQVQGLAKAPCLAKQQAIAARMLQHDITFSQVEDALSGKELMDGDNEQEIVADMDDLSRGIYERQKRNIARLSELTRVSASVKKSSRNGSCEVVWANNPAAPKISSCEGATVVSADRRNPAFSIAHSLTPNDGSDGVAVTT
jgi:hypothetical protein